MAQQTILYLHGFASSGQGTKAQYFRRKFEPLPQVAFHAVEFNPTIQDFEFMTITGAINRLRQYLLDHPPGRLGLIGSSLGALIGLHYVHRFGGVERMLLLAPALAYLKDKYPETIWQQWQQEGTLSVEHYAFGGEVPLRYDYHRDGLRYCELLPSPIPLLIIHGRQDEVVPIDHSRRYVARYPDHTQLLEVEAGHQLNEQLDFIWDQVRSFLLSSH